MRLAWARETMEEVKRIGRVEVYFGSHMTSGPANCIRMVFKAGRRMDETTEGGTGRQSRALGPATV